jgi:hypothetical protein
LSERFKCFGGYKLIRSLANGGIGIEVFAAEAKTGDGVIPYPFAIVDELHRHDDLRLYSLWKGKLRKRGGQILTISTAGEPETPFENTRDEIRRRATKRERVGASCVRRGRAWCCTSGWSRPTRIVLGHGGGEGRESVVEHHGGDVGGGFRVADDGSGDWKRLKCNRPTRSVQSAITDKEWDDAQVDDEIPAGAGVDVGLDIAFKWDTTALVPLWKARSSGLLGDKGLVPPRDGSSMHPDVIKDAMLELGDDYRIDTVVMDMERAADIARGSRTSSA